MKKRTGNIDSRYIKAIRAYFFDIRRSFVALFSILVVASILCVYVNINIDHNSPALVWEIIGLAWVLACVPFIKYFILYFRSMRDLKHGNVTKKSVDIVEAEFKHWRKGY